MTGRDAQALAGRTRPQQVLIVIWTEKPLNNLEMFISYIVSENSYS